MIIKGKKLIKLIQTSTNNYPETRILNFLLMNQWQQKGLIFLKNTTVFCLWNKIKIKKMKNRCSVPEQNKKSQEVSVIITFYLFSG